MSLGGLWVWLPWKGTCQMKSVDGDAIKHGGGKLGISAFFPKIWHISLLSLRFSCCLDTPSPKLPVPGMYIGHSDSSILFPPQSPLLGTKYSFFHFCVHIGHESLPGTVPCTGHIAPSLPVHYSELHLNSVRCFLVPVATIKAKVYCVYTIHEILFRALHALSQ